MIFGEDHDLARLKWAFESCKNGAWGDEPDGETDAVCIRAADFDADLGKLNDGERTLRSIDDTTYRKVGLRAGDLVVEKSGGGEKQLVGRSVIYSGSERAVCSNFLARCRPSDLVTSGYLNYLMLGIYKARGTYPHIKQTTGIQNLDMASFLNTRVKLPPLETQKRIAAFLDEKTARIDALIAKKQALLERLAEKRQAIITQAVTKGLNPAAPMKDSGIDWLGQIPTHWEVRRIKELGRLIGGAGFPHEFQGFTDLELPFFKVMDLGLVEQNELLVETTNTIDRALARALGASIIIAGDIVFAKVGAALLLNRFRMIGRDCCIDNNMMAFRPSELVSSEYALQALSRIKFADIVNPGAVPSVNGKQIGELPVALPPVDEQAKIAAYLRDRSAALEYAEGQVDKTCKHLAEYRAALITSAVTSQIEGLQ